VLVRNENKRRIVVSGEVRKKGLKKVWDHSRWGGKKGKLNSACQRQAETSLHETRK